MDGGGYDYEKRDSKSNLQNWCNNSMRTSCNVVRVHLEVQSMKKIITHILYQLRKPKGANWATLIIKTEETIR